MDEFRQKRRRSTKNTFKQKRKSTRKSVRKSKRKLPPYLQAWNQQVRKIWMQNKQAGMTYKQAMMEAKRQRDGGFL